MKKIILVLFLAALLTFVLVNYFIFAYKVQGDSMKPVLYQGDRIIVWKWNVLKSLRRFDLIVFYQPDEPQKMLVKRVIGLPGEIIAISNNQILINGKVLNEELGTNSRYEVYQEMLPQKIPAAHFFVLGDNRFLSVDSRAFGFVPEKYIIGKVIWRYWPIRTMGGVE